MKSFIEIIGFHFKKEEMKMNEVLAKGIKAKEVARELVLKTTDQKMKHLLQLLIS